MNKICSICKEEKTIDNFYSNGTTPAGTKKFKPFCKPCEMIKTRKDHYLKIRKILKVNLLKCELCGYSENLAALEFHHLDEDEKDKGIGQLKKCSESRLKEELEKCVLLCANCHKEHHYSHLNQSTFLGTLV
jgi:hypothetical protein